MNTVLKYRVGDKVLYPNRGAGTIVGLENAELVDGFQDYYVIEIQSQRLTLRIPTGKMQDLGVRKVMPRHELRRVWDALSDTPQSLPEDYKERQEQIRERLRTGSPLDIAEAVRDLSWRERQTYLTKADSKLLAQGRELLVDEVSLVLDRDNTEAERLLDEALAVHDTDEDSDGE